MREIFRLAMSGTPYTNQRIQNEKSTLHIIPIVLIFFKPYFYFWTLVEKIASKRVQPY